MEARRGEGGRSAGRRREKGGSRVDRAREQDSTRQVDGISPSTAPQLGPGQNKVVARVG